MGIEDRDYYREFTSPHRPNSLWNGVLRNIVYWIIGLNAFFFFIDAFLFPQDHKLLAYMSMHSSTLSHWYYWYEFLTYGFAHHPGSISHLFFNMLTLFFFAPHIIRRYGAGEFLFVYLLSIFVGGLYWGIAHSSAEQAAMLGASGGVMTVLFLFVLNNPRATIFFWFFPMPAWAVAVLFVLMNVFGFQGPFVAHDVHIVGVVFAAIYFFSKIRLCNIFRLFKGGFGTRSPKMKIHNPPKKEKSSTNSSATITVTSPEAQSFPQKIDLILRKIAKDGESSLTQEERELLFRASQEFQKRKK